MGSSESYCLVDVREEDKIVRSDVTRTMLLVADDDLPDRQSPFSPATCVLSEPLATWLATPERV